jgi:integrase
VSSCSKDNKKGKKARSNPTKSKTANKGINKKPTNDNGRVIIHSNNDIPSGREEGNNSRLGCDIHESQDLGPAEDNPPGTGEQSLPVNLCDIEDVEMKLAEIEEQFIQRTKLSLKDSTRREYLDRYREMSREQNLEKYTKRQLAGPKGKQLIIDYISTVPRSSVRTQLAAIKRVWLCGLELPWPIDNKMDIGKCPKVRRLPTPPDKLVKEWGTAVAKEKDPYWRLVWLLTAQFGWRPSHSTGIRWSDIQHDELGKPYAIIAAGQDGEFKTNAPVIVTLWPDVAQALEDWRAIHPSPNSNGWFLPHRTVPGKLDTGRRMTTKQFERHWAAIRKKYGLPKLTPKDLRHWVSTSCRRAGLSKQASACLQGHDAEGGGSMRDWYDNPQVEDLLQEQKDHFLNGPLGTLTPIEVELMEDIPPEALSLMKDYFAGQLGTMSLMQSMEELKRKADAKPAIPTL